MVLIDRAALHKVSLAEHPARPPISPPQEDEIYSKRASNPDLSALMDA
jgi:hypothetical protein